jgi:hypothetical protein
MSTKSWKSLFVNDEDGEQNVEQPKPSMPQTSTTTKFPTSAPETPTVSFTMPQSQPTFASSSNGSVPQEYINKAIEVYRNGFDSLNQAGYDFYEFFQAVMQVGVDNPQIYAMAFTMGSAMDKSVTKDKLLQSADFYTNEIMKVYNNFVSQGAEKRQQLLSQKESENHSLTMELDTMVQQMEALKIQIQDRQNKLNAIDGKYSPMIQEVENKISANTTAKDQIMGSIQQVKNGIINNLK